MGLNFDDVADRVDCGSGSSLDDLTTFTWIFWFNPKTLNNFDFIARKAVTGNDQKQMFVIADGSFRFQVKRATAHAEARAAAGTLASDTFQMVAATYDSTNGPKLYKGSLTETIAEVSYTASYPVVGSGTEVTEATGNFVIGTNFDADLPGAGDISTVMVINRELGVGELRQLQFNPHKISGTVGFWQLGYAGGVSTQPDWSGTGNAGTITGASQVGHFPLGLPFEV